MTMLDPTTHPPRLICGVARAAFGTTQPLACTEDMGHPGNVHRDRMGRTWELPLQYTTRQHHADVVTRLVALNEGTLQLLESIAGQIHDPEGIMRLGALAAQERERIAGTLVAMGIAERAA